ncbi:alpha/beta fold hydrolase [Rhizobium sp. KVB221]|uniref:Alpha/beta fold hydrolase n=1 Tax=Rhizobium setariae TaxID=2801340 RepID=A0A936YTZ5_9HYPH|nr:alpha/beta fold hydrolase [Rhizobium setariae]MBL0373051.1 alpha/beta fold hydrolase [Rhizobium setariae]
MLRFFALMLVSCLTYALPAEAKELARRPFLGIAMKTVESKETSGGPAVRVDHVIENSSASDADLRSGDMVVSVDGKEISSQEDVIAAIKPKREGDVLKISLLRDGHPISKDVPLIGLPLEKSSDFETIYEAVVVDGTKRRTITTRPREATRFPAVLFVGGIGCYSMESPLDDQEVYRQLLSSLTRQGFVTMRVEKSGMGDSEGPPCATIDLDAEKRGYIGGLNELKSKPYVDPDRVFIVGHSIGGIVGPLVAAQAPVRAIVAMETVGTTWFEYELINRRRQLKLAGTAPEALGRQMQVKQWCMHRLLIERDAREDIVQLRPECKEEMQIPTADVYLQQIAALDLPALWAKLKIDTLLIYGSADYLTSAEEHLAIAEVVNAERPNSATFIEISDLDHYMTRVESQRESFDRRRSERPAAYHDGLGTTIGRWLKDRPG